MTNLASTAGYWVTFRNFDDRAVIWHARLRQATTVRLPELFSRDPDLRLQRTRLLSLLAGEHPGLGALVRVPLDAAQEYAHDDS